MSGGQNPYANDPNVEYVEIQDDGTSGPITFQKADRATRGFGRGYLTVKWNLFPVGLLLVDVGLSTSGLSAIFGVALSFKSWATMLLFFIGGFVLSSGQMYFMSALRELWRKIKANKNLPKGSRTPIAGLVMLALGFLVLWVIDQGIDWIGYTYGVTGGDRELAMGVLLPKELQSAGYWLGGMFLWFLALINEPVWEYRSRVGSLK
jgi:hypothetical protein